MASPPWARALVLVAGLLLPPLVILVVSLAPEQLPTCASKATLGISCPGCGLGRGLMALGQGDLPSALRAYPPLVGLACCYLLLLGLAVARLMGKRSEALVKLAQLAGLASAALILLTWALRALL